MQNYCKTSNHIKADDAGPEDEDGMALSEYADPLCSNKDDERITIDTDGGNHKPSIQGDMLNSVNNLRLNVNNRIISKVRKLSITELNRRRKSTRHAKLYRLAFYVTITLLSFLFLYLIYQNLFNE